MSRLHPLLQPFAPGAEDPFDAIKAAHLLNRAGFGGTAREVETVLSLGPEKAVDWLLHFPDIPAEEQSRTDAPDLSSIEGYPRTFAERRRLYLGKTPEERQQLQNQLMASNREAIGATIGWWLNRMAYGPHPLQEKLALFWHGHFTTSARDERSAWLMWQQNETLRTNAAGNFRQFVRQISRDPAMLDYLNNQQNRKARPNENFARELMELFTLGIGHYTEQDVQEAARAFTGWAHDGDDYIFRRGEHDSDEKSFLGRHGKFGGDEIIDIILAHRACAPYIVRRLWTFFVSEQPDENIVQNLGEILRDSNWELRPVLRTIFTSRAFYQSQHMGAQIKSPVQLLAGTVRLLGIEMPPARQVYAALDQMGQVPMMPPNVKGWPGGRAWINTNTLFVRYNTCVWLAGGGRAVGGGDRRYFVRRGQDEAAATFAPQAGTSAQHVVDDWVMRLIQRPITAARRQVLIEALADEPDSQESVQRMVQLIVSMPEYQLC